MTEDRTYQQLTRRLIPFFMLCYVIAYLDRINIGFAKRLHMIHKGAGRSLHATPKTLHCIMHCSLENKNAGGARTILIAWSVAPCRA